VKGIADTGFLAAFVNRADEHHDWAVAGSGGNDLADARREGAVTARRAARASTRR
jgi:predicted nucleic acid-binding protein